MGLDARIRKNVEYKDVIITLMVTEEVYSNSARSLVDENSGIDGNSSGLDKMRNLLISAFSNIFARPQRIVHVLILMPCGDTPIGSRKTASSE